MSVHLVLIDALNLIRRIYAVQERPFLSNNEITENTKKQIVNNTNDACQQAISKIKQYLMPSHALAVFDTQQPSWRHQLYPQYKQGRKKIPTHLEEHLSVIQDDFFLQQIDSLQPQGDEAEDIIATLAVKVALHGHKTTIISTNKKFLSLLSANVQVYDHFNRQHLDAEYVVNKFNVKPDKLVDLWSLTGDKTNNIPGVPGIGQVNASHILNQYGSISNCLNNENIKTSINNKLIEGSEQLSLSKKLLTHRLDIPLGFNLQDIRLT